MGRFDPPTQAAAYHVLPRFNAEVLQRSEVVTEIVTLASLVIDPSTLQIVKIWEVRKPTMGSGVALSQVVG